jgi:RNA polymerase sigma-70 factor, ECF subfamily
MVESLQITALLQAWGNGDATALEKLIPLVDRELRKIAHSYMTRERADNPLQTTALINEAVIRLIKAEKIEWRSRLQFYAIAARRMRQILVEHAREQLAAKRGRRVEHVEISKVAHLSTTKSQEVMLLNAALSKLARLDNRKSDIVEYRYFGGLTTPEIADLMGLSATTIEREWRLARAWLHREISDTAENRPSWE